MIVVDSSGWIEYFSAGANAARFAGPIEDPPSLAVPTIVLYEVHKWTARFNEPLANAALTAMLQAHLIELSASLAIQGAKLSAETGLAMADAIILATARAHDATLWTQDAHFEGIPGVRYIASQG